MLGRGGESYHRIQLPDDTWKIMTSLLLSTFLGKNQMLATNQLAVTEMQALWLDERTMMEMLK